MISPIGYNPIADYKDFTYPASGIMLLKIASAKRIGLQLIEDPPETALVDPRSCHKNLGSRLTNDQLVFAHL